ncbi:hypothetical protein MK280_05185 [Myxococcota bacterium]|nr:hypothetical protein [Myxococcota bacterium]
MKSQSSATQKTRELGEVTDRSAESRPELTDATRYDFDRLERAVRSLVEQQTRLSSENQQLRDQLAQRDVEAERLNGEIQDAQLRREGAIARVDALMAELDRLDARLDEAVANASAEGSL